jgi:hypothetical protein
MEENEVKGLIKAQSGSCDDKYVQEKVYWQRTVKMIVVVISMLLGLSGGMIAWGFKVSTELTNNTQGRHELERRMEVFERQNAVVLEQYDNVAKNQQEVLTYTKRLSGKLDVLIDRAGAKYRE